MKTYFVDSFTSQRFKGNPAAVCITKTPLESLIMQDVATEIGFSETAFIHEKSEGTYDIRFFTPKKEISICGHATLAAAKVVFDKKDLQQASFFNCDQVELKTWKTEEGISMQFPVFETTRMDIPQPVLRALGIHASTDTRFCQDRKIILIEIDNPLTLAALAPDFPALVNSYNGINGVLVTAQSTTPDFDFHYRYFWPWAGTNEDPVTGGVQTFLTKYWAEKLGKNILKSFQSSRRTGMMITELLGETVLISGTAVIVLEGTFIL